MESHLGNLSLGKGQGGSLIDKKFKHLCYMFESFYAVALRQEDNITRTQGVSGNWAYTPQKTPRLVHVRNI
jgi:hypothetical protein